MISWIVTLFFLVSIPIINYVEVSKLKNLEISNGKEKMYIKIYFWYIIFTSLFLTQTSFSELFYPKYLIQFKWQPNFIMWILIAYMTVTVVLPLIALPFNRQLREKVAEDYDEKLYPVTQRQQIMFVFVSITVGICEEIIFRGFLYNYLQDYFSVSAMMSFILVSVVFGLGHFMQGVSGVISSTIFGLIMGYLYFTTGSLLVPIIVHILYDAKAVYITRVLQKSV